MPYVVHYSPRAFDEYEAILDYVIEKFGAAAASKVNLHFEETIDHIAINPILYPHCDKAKKLRRCVISPQTTLYYRFNGKCVELVSFRGNVMDPQSLGL